MKKNRIIAFIFMVATICLALAACGGTKFTVDFDTNGGSSVGSQSLASGEKVKEPTMQARTGYDFDGWYISDTDFTEQNKWSFEKNTVTQKLTLYAKWDVILYDIEYVLDGGTNNQANPTKYSIESATIVLQTPSKPDHKFAKWTEGNSITNGSTGDRTFTAEWTVEHYTVTCDYRDATEISGEDTYSVTYNSSYSLPTPSRTNHTFGGWFTEINGGGTQCTDGTGNSVSTWLIDEDTTLYPYWLGTNGLSYTSIDGGTAYSVKKGTASLVPVVYIQEYYLGKPVTAIADGGFRAYAGASIRLPSTLTVIGNKAFENCSNLTSLAIPTSVLSIDDYAFTSCRGLTLIIQSTTPPLTKVNTFASIKAIIVPDSELSVYKSSWESASSIIYSDADAADNNSIVSNGVLVSYFGNGDSYTLPNSVTSIGQYAFLNNNSLNTLIIPFILTNIDDNAFHNCNGLTDITINAVTNIGIHSFYGCSSLVNVTVQNGSTRISEYAFQNCVNLENLIVPEGMSSVGDFAFDNCKSLERTSLADGISKISNSAFRGCESLESINIPSSVTSIGEYAFLNCKSLQALTISSESITIMHSAFRNCTELTITMQNTTPPNQIEGFYGVKAIIVPAASLDLYKSAWSTYADIIHSDED